MKSRMQQDTLSINVATEGGRTVPEAHAPGTGWIDVDFTKAMCIAWNWDDLLQDICSDLDSEKRTMWYTRS